MDFVVNQRMILKPKDQDNLIKSIDEEKRKKEELEKVHTNVKKKKNMSMHSPWRTPPYAQIEIFNQLEIGERQE